MIKKCACHILISAFGKILQLIWTVFVYMDCFGRPQESAGLYPSPVPEIYTLYIHYCNAKNNSVGLSHKHLTFIYSHKTSIHIKTFEEKHFLTGRDSVLMFCLKHFDVQD